MSQDIETKLGYVFKSPSLRDEALTHPSAASALKPSYQRLEFLGDRVLGLVVARLLIQRFPGEAEGDLAKRHAVLVSRETAARAAGALGIAPFIKLSKGEDEAGGRSNPTALGDVMEALLGAIYLDGGLAPAEALVVRLWEPLLAEDLSPPKDAKTTLQEWSQARSMGLPVYSVLSQSGPAHDPKFLILARIGDNQAQGEGNSKRAAEQMAAKALLETLTHD
ncbi:MAG: ribonuclease III [Alphaproteobacteria bacterium]|nr:ribonuclease III [Alphaproteobacteria bacterium]